MLIHLVFTLLLFLAISMTRRIALLVHMKLDASAKVFFTDSPFPLGSIRNVGWIGGL